MKDEPAERGAPEDGARGSPSAPTLRPRWLWIVFGLIAILIPLIGLWLERAR